MPISPTAADVAYQREVHRVALLFALVVFPLIWVGGLVTTYDAGMAVPDWPNTYGYNLFLYPVYDWIFGPWDLFVEHGHRLLATLAGLIAIAMVYVACRFDRRRWFVWLAVAALLLVIVQGVLGGLRVVLDQRQLAKIHGCLGPTFFALVVALSVCSSKWWFQRHPRPTADADRRIRELFWTSATLFVLSWTQLVIGASLRHMLVDTDPMVMRSLLMAHLSLAAAILIGSCFVAWSCGHRPLGQWGIRKFGLALLVCVLVQIGLGMGTWVVKFGWPAWLDTFEFASVYIIREKSFLQMNIVTGHVAVGSLLLAVSTVLVIRTLRVAGSIKQTAVGNPASWEKVIA